MSDENKYKIKWSSKFKKEYKAAMKRGLDMNLIDDVIRSLAKDDRKKLEQDYGDHPLTGNWKGHRELRVLPDWILIYFIEDDVLVLTLSRTGTHSDLYKK